jgi:glycosyltransferase involved in cell wall biosynthesis
LDAFALQNPRLSVLHVRVVPEGWVGKTHALNVGYRQARGDWLLFTDADIIFHRQRLQVAVAYAENESLDHLVLAPAVEVAGFWEPVLVGCFGLLFGLLFRPWAARNPRSRAFGDRRIQSGTSVGL